VSNRSTRNIQYTCDLLRRLEADFTQAGLPYLMVVIPARHQIRPSVHPATTLLEKSWLRSYVYSQNLYVIDHFIRDGIPYVDTYPPLAARDANESVVFPDDPHTNALGHEIIAATIFEAIEPRIEKIVEARSYQRTP
jgi:hypothetical protein